MGKVSTDLAPCHLAHLSPERLIVPSQQEAADCPKQIESNFEHQSEYDSEYIDRKHDDMFHSFALSKMGWGVVK